MMTEVAEFEDTDDARVDAAIRVGLLLHAHANQIWVDEDWQMDVTDETGVALFVLIFQPSRTQRREDRI